MSRRSMSTLLFERSLPRFAAARLASSFGSGRGAGVGPLRLVEHDAPVAARRGLGARGSACSRESAARTCPPWTGAARATSKRSSRSPSSRVTRWWARSPPTPWGRTATAGRRHPCRAPAGARLRRPRYHPLCPACAAGHVGNCGHLAFGHIRPGLQTGFCADTGGGWSTTGLVAHSSQLFAVPDGLSDADAVTTEPVACAVHAVLGAGIREGRCGRRARRRHAGAHGDGGAGPSGGHRPLPRPARCWSAPSTAISSELAREFGATEALPPDQLARAVRRHSHSLSYGGSPARPPLCPAGPMWSSTAWAAPNRSPSRWPWSGPVAPSPWSACPAR